MAWFDFKKFGNRLARTLTGRQGGAGVLHWNAGWKDVVGAIPVTVCVNDVKQYQTAFIAREACLVVGAQVVWSTAESSAGHCSVVLERLRATEAPGAGDQCSAAANCKGTADTVQTLAIRSADDYHKLAVGNRIGLKLSAAPTELANMCVTLWIVPQALPAATGFVTSTTTTTTTTSTTTTTAAPTTTTTAAPTTTTTAAPTTTTTAP